jgi:cell division protein FtsW
MRSALSAPVERWWRSVDHGALALIALIATLGIVILMAAGPAASARLNIDREFYFPIRQILFLAPALALAVAASSLSPLHARRLGAVVFLVALVSMAAALLFAPEVNGARRWFYLGGISFQPSEFAKPGFIVTAAWMLAEGARNARFPGIAAACGLYLVFAALLALQPDYGQAILATAAFATACFVAGASLRLFAALTAVAAGGAAFAVMFSPHFAARIEAFFDPAAQENYQARKAVEAIADGGLLGRIGEGAEVKLSLPDAHTDYIFAVAAEEGGFVLALSLIGLFAALVVMCLLRAAKARSLFAQCAASGLAALIGLQSFINIAVALRAVPAKGMTLPLVSYGGSSLLATGLTLGLMLALTRSGASAMSRREIMP